MKKSLFLLLPLLLLGVITSCDTVNNPSDPSEPNDSTQVAPTITLGQDTLVLGLEQTYQLTPTITPTGADTELTWTSSNPTVATIDANGIVTTLVEGETTVTVKAMGVGEAQCLIIVTAQDITLNTQAMEFYVYDTYLLTATLPAHKQNARVTWKSSNTNIATVDNKGYVTGVAAGTAIITASAKDCQPAECFVTIQAVTLDYDRKFLLEHFTGDACGYCPGGMFAITEHIKSAKTPYIWVSHHYGYNQDEYTLPESEKIGKMLGINGAPTMTLNRTDQSKGLKFHPGYLPELKIADETKAPMSIEINHDYNTSTRQLDFTVSGKTSHNTHAKYLLSVLIKENGLIGAQADYQYAFGDKWKEFLHPRIAREFISFEFGDTITIEGQAYSKSFQLTLNDEWVDKNCCIVAYLTPLSKMPIINAEQVAVVEGTLGGENYWPIGITDLKSPSKATKLFFDTIYYEKPEADKLVITMYTDSSARSNAHGAVKPLLVLEVNTSASTLAEGTYEISDSNTNQSVVAGKYDMDAVDFTGSCFYYVSKKEDTMIERYAWYLTSGQLTVDAAGNYVVEGKLSNAKDFKMTYLNK